MRKNASSPVEEGVYIAVRGLKVLSNVPGIAALSPDKPDDLQSFVTQYRDEIPLEIYAAYGEGAGEFRTDVMKGLLFGSLRPGKNSLWLSAYGVRKICDYCASG